MKVYIDKLQAQIAETDKKLYETNFDLTKAQEVLKIKIACLRVTSVIRTFCGFVVVYFLREQFYSRFLYVGNQNLMTPCNHTTIYGQFVALTLCLTDYVLFCINLLGSIEHKGQFYTKLNCLNQSNVIQYYFIDKRKIHFNVSTAMVVVCT